MLGFLLEPKNCCLKALETLPLSCQQGMKNGKEHGSYLRIGDYRGGCQNHGPFLGTLKTRCRIIIGIQKEAIILTTTPTRATVRIHSVTPC